MGERVFVAEHEGTVDALADRAALEEGRVFIGKRRAKPGDAVRAGDAVRISERREVEVVVEILHRDDRFVVVDKPAGIATIPDEHEAEGSLVWRTARALGVAPESLHVTSRLDRGVSGVVVFARTERAREQLQNARNSGRYFRQYAAIASKSPTPPEGSWDAPIGRARDPKKRMVGGREAQSASTRYRVVAAAARGAVLSVEPVTGRTHQIRVHASHAGAPLLGDRDYGGSRTLVLPTGKVLALERVALHCARVAVKGLVDVRAPIPSALRECWLALGGDDAAWIAFD
jgi:23S rRNA pseudouridine1911/1915/1917 synthase